jgi:hypothetical protein
MARLAGGVDGDHAGVDEPLIERLAEVLDPNRAVDVEIGAADLHGDSLRRGSPGTCSPTSLCTASA